MAAETLWPNFVRAAAPQAVGPGWAASPEDQGSQEGVVTCTGPHQAGCRGKRPGPPSGCLTLTSNWATGNSRKGSVRPSGGHAPFVPDPPLALAVLEVRQTGLWVEGLECLPLEAPDCVRGAAAGIPQVPAPGSSTGSPEIPFSPSASASRAPASPPGDPCSGGPEGDASQHPHPQPDWLSASDTGTPCSHLTLTPSTVTGLSSAQWDPQSPFQTLSSLCGAVV